MTQEQSSFPAGIDFQEVLGIISKQVYETPLAFIRENVQNAVDAIQIQARRDGVEPSDGSYRIDVTVEQRTIVVHDNGIGMSATDLQDFFWTIGASGKRTQEAVNAGCVGTFGIGGFANFGVCESLEVISQTKDCDHGTRTRLTEAEIQMAGTASPQITVENSNKAQPRGTVVMGYLRHAPDPNELLSYLLDFVRYVRVAVFFNGEKISQSPFRDIENRENYTELGLGSSDWCDGELVLSGQLFEDQGNTLAVQITGLAIDGETTKFEGFLRFENGIISVFKHGFKLCATQIGSTIGVSGRLDCSRFVPTAGRDSLDSETTSLLGRIVHMMEKFAVETVLESPDRLAQHTRIFRYVVRNGMVSRLDNAVVHLADGSDMTLGDIRTKAEQGIGVFFGLSQKQALNQIMHARGHLVVLLSSDRYRRDAERQYLEQYCAANPFEGIIDCSEHYHELSRFEKIFLSELELNISRSYEVEKFHLIPGKLTEDIPVFLKDNSLGQPLDIFVDVRHPEIVKLKVLGFTDLLYSLISTFCREFLGPSLKRWSPRFFGDGSLNLDLLSKRRSELWILVKDDIDVVLKGKQQGQRDVVTRADVQEVTVGDGENRHEPSLQKRPARILHIIDKTRTTEIGGYYLRVPDSAFKAYGDLLPPCESRGVVWAGNKIHYVASDAVSAAFQYEIRLDQLITARLNGEKQIEGAIELDLPLQEMYEGIYFPIPRPLEDFLVPAGDEEIRVHLYCEWIDMRTSKHWITE